MSGRQSNIMFSVQFVAQAENVLDVTAFACPECIYIALQFLLFFLFVGGYLLANCNLTGAVRANRLFHYLEK